MMTIMRNIFSQFIVSVALVITVLIITFFLFPLEDWHSLITVKIYHIPFIALVFIIVSIFSIISGIVTSQYWRQRIYYAERQIQHLINGHTISEIGRASCRERV